MKYSDVFLGLGSNIGNRDVYLRTAIEMLQEDEKVCVVQESSVIETLPIGDIAEGLFLNQVLEIETEYEPMELLHRCLVIEQSQGRIRERKWESRTLDIDILFFGEQIIRSDVLLVPHPEIERRRFVLQPLFEISPDFKHPITNETMRHCLDTLVP
jgi:2-amino-4-hydroxy-6-hydroxymethyldihydropteridine diphosphokinase